MMDVLFVRHAPAGDKAACAKAGKPDSERPLTAEGRRQMKKGAAGLRRILATVDMIATSPLARAIETGRILRKAYGKVTMIRERAASKFGIETFRCSQAPPFSVQKESSA